MSWNISLVDKDGAPVEFALHNDGTTLCFSADGTAGRPLADMGVTYNYGKFFRFGDLNGKRAADTLVTLVETVSSLGVERNPDYWAPTPGNVGYACSMLLRWASEHPTAVWEVR